jgi:hypothetical protein
MADRLIFRNHSRAFGDDHKCDSDDACRAFFASDAGGAFDATTHSGAPRDFDCNLAARRCWGLDSRTNVYTICRTMLRPLFALSERAKVPLALARDRATYGNAATAELQQLMWQCEANNPHDRISAAALQKSLRALAARFGGDDAEKLPPFEPRNPAASGYVSLQELSKAALTAGALEAAERAAAALVANDIVVRLPNGTSGRRQWLKEHVDANGDLEGSVDSLGRWHPHAEFYNPPIVLTDWFFRLALPPDVARSPDRPVVRLAGVAGEQSWLSSPVRHWISARELATTQRQALHSARRRRLQGPQVGRLRRSHVRAVSRRLSARLARRRAAGVGPAEEVGRGAAAARRRAAAAAARQTRRRRPRAQRRTTDAAADDDAPTPQTDDVTVVPLPRQSAQVRARV